MNDFCIENALLSQSEILFSLETDSFSQDEAASLESIRYRINNANEYFLVLKGKDNVIIGFINGTCTPYNTVHHDSMSSHDKNGTTLVIHSVVIEKSLRRKGIAAAFMKEYIQRLVPKDTIQLILLLSKAYLLRFYVSCGCKVEGLSSVAHGQENWFELSYDLTTARQLEQVQVDAFSLKAYSGNPAAVVFQHKDDEWMQNLAMENNLAETAFVERIPDSTMTRYKIRWFTPRKEVELCGHATLAAAHALYQTKRVQKLTPIHFETVYSGVLIAQGMVDDTIQLNFPATPPQSIQPSPEELNAILKGLCLPSADKLLYIGKSVYDYFVEVSIQDFFALQDQVDHNAISALKGRGLVLTCLGVEYSKSLYDQVFEGMTHPKYSDYSIDFFSRCFFPRFGINEDPVTGSAHCALAPYWFEKINSLLSNRSLSSTLDTNKCLKIIREKLVGLQASDRGGIVNVSLDGNRVLLAGSCVTTIKGRVIC